MSDRVDQELLKNVQERIKNLELDDLRMNTQSLADAMFKRKWFNPFPKFKFTERPDTGRSVPAGGKGCNTGGQFAFRDDTAHFYI